MRDRSFLGFAAAVVILFLALVAVIVATVVSVARDKEDCEAKRGRMVSEVHAPMRCDTTVCGVE